MLHDIVFQKDGKALIGGRFSSYNGYPANSLVRINPDGTIDPSFDTKVGFGIFFKEYPYVKAIGLQPDGKVIIGGLFDSYDSWPANGIVRLNADGSRDYSFVVGTGFSGREVSWMSVQPDGKIYVAGNFYTYKEKSLPSLIR